MNPERPSTWKLTRFFIPLAIQAVSQALSYPLVAMVASRGPGGPLNLAGLAQSNTVMFFIGMIEFYYVKLQKLAPQDMHLVRLTALFLIFFPISVGIRAQREGLAAWLKKPTTVLAGHAVFMAAVIVSGLSLLNFGIAPELIGPVGLTIGSLASSATMRLALSRAKERAFPEGPTTTSLGQIR